MILSLVCMILLPGFTYVEEDEETFNLDDLYDYQKEYVAEEMELCSDSAVKSYMDYRMVTLVTSKQYRYIHQKMTVDEKTGLLYDEEGFIGIALGSFFGEIGDRFYFTLETGVILPLVKCEEKADEHVNGGCVHKLDASVIEFVIDGDKAGDFFGRYGNGYVLSGNFNNYDLFSGKIVKVEKLTDEKLENYVTYYRKDIEEYEDFDIFNYASGY